MANLSVAKSPPKEAVVPFYVSGALFFMLFCLLLFFNAQVLMGHYFNGIVLSMVHFAVLGWGTSLIFGAAYQLIPVVCEHDLYSPKLAKISWYFLTLGTLLLATSFWKLNSAIMMIGGGSLIVLAAIFYGVNVFMTSKLFAQPTVVKLFLVSSAIYLIATVIVGLLLAINLHLPYLMHNHLDYLKLHAHLGLAGWFLQLITGVSCKLIPMFLLGKSSKEYLLKWSFIFQNAGLVLFVLDGYFIGLDSVRILCYAFLVLVGISFWILYLADVYKNRMRKKIDIQMKQSLISFVFLLLALLTIPIILYHQDTRWAMLYGSFLVMGWITGIILGKTFKTLPFIIWNVHYKKLSGKSKIPFPKDLYNNRLIDFQWGGYILTMLCLGFGLGFGSFIMVKIGTGFAVLMALSYLMNVLKVVFHQSKIKS